MLDPIRREETETASSVRGRIEAFLVPPRLAATAKARTGPLARPSRSLLPARQGPARGTSRSLLARDLRVYGKLGEMTGRARGAKNFCS